MERLGITTVAEVEVEGLSLRIRDEVLANNGNCHQSMAHRSMGDAQNCGNQKER